MALDAGYLTVLPDGVDVRTVGPVLCAGVTAYKVSVVAGGLTCAVWWIGWIGTDLMTLPSTGSHQCGHHTG